MSLEYKLGVCVVSVDHDLSPWSETAETISSIHNQSLDGEIHVVVLHNSSELNNRELRDSKVKISVRKIDTSLPGGLFFHILHAWLSMDAKYVSYLEAGNTITEGSLNKQMELMQGYSLSACYGDTQSNLLDPPRIERSKDFNPDMIGLRCFNPETLMIDRGKFLECGGFDQAMSAGYKPHAYLTAYCALGGKVGHLREIVLNQNMKSQIRDKTSTDPAENATQEEMWKRLRFDSFVSKVKTIYRERELEVCR